MLQPGEFVEVEKFVNYMKGFAAGMAYKDGESTNASVFVDKTAELIRIKLSAYDKREGIDKLSVINLFDSMVAFGYGTSSKDFLDKVNYTRDFILQVFNGG